MKRITDTNSGHDCIYAPCHHTPAGDHGIHGDEWIYASVANDGLTALVLTVFTDVFPDTVPAAHQARCAEHYSGRPKRIDERREGADVTLHCAFPTDVNSVREATPGEECEFVGVCFTGASSALKAHEFFAAHGDPAQREQTESFWHAFEVLHADWGESARAGRVDIKHVMALRCRRCARRYSRPTPTTRRR